MSVNGFTYQARTYGMPFATENLALFRNTALAPEAPESIDVMARDGLELKDKDDQILPIALPVGPQGDAYHWYPFYSAAGGKIFGLDTQGGYTADELEVGKPGSIEAAKRLAQLTADGALDKDTTLDEALTAFTTSRSPYLISGPWSVEPVRQAGVPFVVEAVPGFDSVLASRSQAMVTSQGLLLSAFARNAAGAQEYLATTAMTTDVMTALAAPGGLAPAWTDSFAVAASDPVIKGFGDYADASAPMPNLAEMDLVWPALSQAQVDVMSGENPTRDHEGRGARHPVGHRCRLSKRSLRCVTRAPGIRLHSQRFGNETTTAPPHVATSDTRGHDAPQRGPVRPRVPLTQKRSIHAPHHQSRGRSRQPRPPARCVQQRQRHRHRQPPKPPPAQRRPRVRARSPSGPTRSARVPIKAECDKFAEANGITCEVVQIDFGDIRAKVVQGNQTGDVPDLFIGAHDWLGELVTNGVVTPFDLGAKASQLQRRRGQGRRLRRQELRRALRGGEHRAADQPEAVSRSARHPWMTWSPRARRC